MKRNAGPLEARYLRKGDEIYIGGEYHIPGIATVVDGWSNDKTSTVIIDIPADHTFDNVMREAT